MTTPVELLKKRLGELEADAATCREQLSKAREDVQRRTQELHDAEAVVEAFRKALAKIER